MEYGVVKAEYAKLTVFLPVVLFSWVNSAVSLLTGQISFHDLDYKLETDVLSGLPL